MSHAKATAASIVGAVGTLAAALAPNWSSEHQALIVSVGGAISLLLPVVNLGHRLVDQLLSKPTADQAAQQAKDQAIAALTDELSQIDLNGLAAKAIAGQNIGLLVRGELQHLLDVVPAAPPAPTGPVSTIPTTSTSVPPANS